MYIIYYKAKKNNEIPPIIGGYRIRNRAGVWDSRCPHSKRKKRG